MLTFPASNITNSLHCTQCTEIMIILLSIIGWFWHPWMVVHWQFTQYIYNLYEKKSTHKSTTTFSVAAGSVEDTKLYQNILHKWFQTIQQKKATRNKRERFKNIFWLGEVELAIVKSTTKHSINIKYTVRRIVGVREIGHLGFK